MKKFKYTGIARDIGGTEAHHYESENWVICIHLTRFDHQQGITIQGTLENMSGDKFDYTLFRNGNFHYARILESMYNGLGRKYDEDDKLVPKYVINKIKEIAKGN